MLAAIAVCVATLATTPFTSEELGISFTPPPGWVTLPPSVTKEFNDHAEATQNPLHFWYVAILAPDGQTPEPTGQSPTVPHLRVVGVKGALEGVSWELLSETLENRGLDTESSVEDALEQIALGECCNASGIDRDRAITLASFKISHLSPVVALFNPEAPDIADHAFEIVSLGSDDSAGVQYVASEAQFPDVAPLFAESARTLTRIDDRGYQAPSSILGLSTGRITQLAGFVLACAVAGAIGNIVSGAIRRRSSKQSA